MQIALVDYTRTHIHNHTKYVKLANEFNHYDYGEKWKHIGNRRRVIRASLCSMHIAKRKDHTDLT